MSEIVTQEQLIAAIHKASEEAKGGPNPNDLFSPHSKTKIISIGTPEHAERLKREEQWRRDNPRPPVPKPPYHVREDGSWEQKFATEEQLATAGNTPLREFVVIVDGQKYCLRQGKNALRIFDSSDAVVGYCHRLSKGERSRINFYLPPTPRDRELGAETGDFLNSEDFGG
jgi:hypothetical protein